MIFALGLSFFADDFPKFSGRSFSEGERRRDPGTSLATTVSVLDPIARVAL